MKSKNQCSAGKMPAEKKPANAAPPTAQQASAGRIILAVVPVHEGTFVQLVTRPAIVVRAWENADDEKRVVYVTAQVFMDGDGSAANDGTPNCLWKTALEHDETGNVGHTWHWPPRI